MAILADKSHRLVENMLYVYKMLIVMDDYLSTTMTRVLRDP